MNAIVSSLFCAFGMATIISAFEQTLAFNQTTIQETRSIDEIYQAALAEGGVVTLWHGGDEPNQQNALKTAFEKRFPGMTLNVTVDLSKYHDVNLDRQLATNALSVDSVMLQTLHDFPRWKAQGALLNYEPIHYNNIYPDFRDEHAAYYGVYVFSWNNVWHADKTNATIKEFKDFLKPEFKDKLVLTYPNDDDAILFAFDLILQHYGFPFFTSLLAQNPRWVRGTATPLTLLLSPNTSYTATFTTLTGANPQTPIRISFPSNSLFVTWPQTAAILRHAPHPESAKLLHNFVLEEEYQKATGLWSVRRDLPGPNGLPGIFDMEGTDVTKFRRWMEDRGRVERLRFWFEGMIGTAQGASPLADGV